jgi:hypothetical protein
MPVDPGMVDARSSDFSPFYHIRSSLSVVEVTLSVWRILDPFCGGYATRQVGLARRPAPVASQLGGVRASWWCLSADTVLP